MKNLILILACLLLVMPCQAYGKLSPEEIDKYISQQFRNIENYYNGQLVELNQRAESEIRLLEVADKAIFASLAAQAEAAKTTLHIDSYGYWAPWYLVDKTESKLHLEGDFEPIDDFKDSLRNSPKRFAIAQARIADRKSEILAKLEWETVKLEQLKQYALTDGLAQFEKKLKEDAQTPKPAITNGMVTGILYSADKPSALVNSKILHEGYTINGVKVVKIYRDKVVFEKGGKGWDQKVGEKPAAYW
ncbi:MAG: hypothetical protein JW947_02385 [Sedimentisphaerales bacterium]|nr:hypothetical protein [Sedimentisphaerales bacterium]